MYYIYKITNLINNKIYIGQTNNPKQRQSQYKCAAKHKHFSQVITRAIHKYGYEQFLFEIIACCKTQENANFTEIELIKQYDSRNLNIGYNIDAGGDNIERSPETSKKISIALKQYYETHNSHLKGQTLPNEWKENISKSSMGKSGTNNGKQFDDEWRLNISKSQLGKEIKNKRRFSKEIEIEICRLYSEERKSTYWLEKQYNCCRSVIKSILIRNKIEIRKSNYTGHNNGKNIFAPEQELEICLKYETGTVSRAELAKQFGCGKTTVRDILIRHNIKL